MGSPIFSPDFQKRYEIHETLGEGAFGVVFRAENKFLKKSVAIKALKELRDDDVARFSREAQLLAALDHSNILRILDAGVDGEIPYLVTELIDGDTLGRVIETSPPDVRRSLEIVALVADALTYAHGRGIIHRDVKPANIFILRDGSVKLGDFGLAREMVTASRSLTASGILMGTPHYISPEGAMGEKAGPASDQYALGVMLFEMLAGQRPFRGDSALDVVQLQILAAPPALRELSPQVPEAVAAVVARMLAKRPDERFADVREAMRALTEAATVAAPPPEAPARGWRRIFGW